jgi:hypothetical protein
MSTVTIFCIGTWHDHTEQNNALVALHDDCRYYPLGRIDTNAAHHTHIADGAPIPPPRSGGYKLLCDGQGAMGTTLGRQAERCLEIIQSLNTLPNNVRLIGHSRGAVLAILTAHRLIQVSAGIRCQLFLYDPVKRTATHGFDGANSIGCNVNALRIVTSEDEGASHGPVTDFKLLSLNGYGTTNPANWIRIPGTHGTMTQITGTPIGKIGLMLATEWLTQLTPSTPMRNRYGTSTHDFLRVYPKINIYNSTLTKHRRFRSDKVMRHVNDFDPSSGRMSTKQVRVGARSGVLDPIKRNRFMASGFLINEDHYRRFQNVYPALARVIAGRGDHASLEYRRDYFRYRNFDRSGWKIMVDSGAAPSPPLPALPGVRG